MHMPITVETAQKVLSDMGNDIKTRTITYEGIIKVVADHYNVKQDELFNKKRTQNIAFPRQVAMYLCRELADSKTVTSPSKTSCRKSSKSCGNNSKKVIHKNC